MIIWNVNTCLMNYIFKLIVMTKDQSSPYKRHEPIII